MKKNRISMTLLFVLALFVSAATLSAQQKAAPGHDHDHSAFKPKYHQIVVDFPGHKYSLEIIEAEKTLETDKEKTKIEVVKAFLVDAHYQPLLNEVDVKDIKLFFSVNGKMKMFSLPRVKETPKNVAIPEVEPITFESADAELVKLVCGGWKGDAVATMNIGKVPFKAKLVKAGKGNDHAGHSH